MRVIKNWTARRSGASITITGTDHATGEDVKIAGIASIGGAEDRVLASDEKGPLVELVSA